MQIYGVTYTHTSNYGSCLQAFALQYSIGHMSICGEKCEHELVPVDIFVRSISGRKKKSIIKKLRSVLANIYKYRIRQFERQYMRFSSCSAMEMLPALNETADAFVCGSDVIWNPKYNHGLTCFYLDFAEKYAFSYAASFGASELSEAYFQKYGKYIDKLDAISVRESQGLENVARCTDKPASVTVDPVFLLSREQWNELAEAENKNGKYILVYSIGKWKLQDDFVKKLKKQTGLKVKVLVGNQNAALQEKVFTLVSPQRWLQLIRDAEYVVTNSFHGTAFSLIFHKKFFSVVHGKINEGFNIRTYSILSKLGMQERMLNSIPDSIDLSSPDYSAADDRLKEITASSLAFLQTNLEAAYRRKLQTEAKR